VSSTVAARSGQRGGLTIWTCEYGGHRVVVVVVVVPSRLSGGGGGDGMYWCTNATGRL